MFADPRRVLILAYFFPPEGGAGTQRPAKYCKYLPEFGWHPVVITRESDTGPTHLRDETLNADVVDTRVYRIKPTQVSSTRGAVARWCSDAGKQITDIGIDERPELILATLGPFELAELAIDLKQRLDCPLVLDLRDPWALDGVYVYSTQAAWRQDCMRMRRALLAADAIIANTPEALRQFQEFLEPEQRRPYSTCITNGFDWDDFTEADSLVEEESSEFFDIVHTGTFHTKWIYHYRGVLGRLRRIKHYRAEPLEMSGRTPLFLLKAIQKLSQGNIALPKQPRIVHVGCLDQATQRLVQEMGMQAHVCSTGYLDHASSIAWLMRSDAVFLPLHGLPDGHRSRIVPGKTYEYLASGRPILAALPEGDARDFVSDSGRGFCCNPLNSSGIADQICRINDVSSDRRATQFDDAQREFLMQFERRHLTGRLAEVLETVLTQ